MEKFTCRLDIDAEVGPLPDGPHSLEEWREIIERRNSRIMEAGERKLHALVAAIMADRGEGSLH